jgi:hypothetical protein
MLEQRPTGARSQSVGAFAATQEIMSQHCIASPERIQSSETTNMLSDLRLAVNKIPLVPTQHNTASAIYASIAIHCLLKLGNEIVGNADVIFVTEIVLQ